MSPLRLIILLVAAGAAIAAVFLVRTIQTPAPAVAAAAPPPPPVAAIEAEVLVARRNIDMGKFITADDLRWQAWPEKGVAPSFTTKKTSPTGLQGAVGSVALANLVEGEPIVPGKIAKPGDQGFMSVMLTPGMRAISIDINPVSGAGGFILPNDRVDVLMTRNMPASEDPNAVKFKTQKVLQNVRVLAIDAIYGVPHVGEGAAITASRVTLELSDGDAAMLRTAQRAGELALSLRSIANLSEPSGATTVGRAMRDGVQERRDQVRIFRAGAIEETNVAAN